jgi:hypothetical protein
VLFTLQTWPYSTIDVDVTSAGTGTTISYQVSNDNPTNCAASTNWLNVSGNAASLTVSSPILSSGTAGHYVFSTTAACFRAQVTVYGSGTVTAGAYQTAGTPATRSAAVIGTGTASTPAGATNALPVALNPYPAGSTSITASATGTTAATTATLAGVASKTTYLCGFSIDSNATAGTSGNATVTGTITGTLNFTQPVGASPAVGSTFRTFNPCIPASAVNTGIAVNSIAAGTAGVTSVSAWGFQL